MYARIGIPHCPNCGKEIKQQSVDQIVDQILSLPEGTKIQVLAPVVRGKKGEHVKIFEDAKKSGYVRVRVDGIMHEVSEEIKLEKTKKHNIEIIVDRLVIKNDIGKRLTDSLETAMHQTGGLIIIDLIDKEEELVFSQDYACHDCGISVEELSPRMFSFNNPYGACPSCTGLGYQMRVDIDLVIPDKNKTIRDGAVCASGWSSGSDDSMSSMYFTGLAEAYNFSLDVPVKKLPQEALDVILYGTKGKKIKFSYERSYGKGTYLSAFEGVINNLERRYRETSSDWMKVELESLMTNNPCDECRGARLKKEVLAVTVGDKNINDTTTLSVVEARRFFNCLTLTEKEQKIAEQILKEINERLGFLESVGLDYLTLSRSAGTLSGGEAQRIRLATQIGSSLMGVLYILDEPSIGLHQRDNNKLLATLRRLRDLGNTLIVVEHDEDTMYAADHIIDIGPGAGVNGGYVVAEGDIEEIMRSEKSETGLYLSGKKKIPVPDARRKGNGEKLKILGAKENNLKNINVNIPLGTFTCVTGVSGSGKSSLINEILYKRLAAELNRAKKKAGSHEDMIGIDKLDKVIDINQSPIGRTPRSNPATYTGLFGDIRDLYASTNDAKMRGYKTGRFSFNVKGGRCEACQGDGIIKIEMHFLPDVYVPCEVCKGKRYNRETLEVLYKGKNIDEILNMTIDQGLEFFENVPKIARKLKTIQEVGLGYIKIGQPSTTLSGGEAQRVKLATELSKRSTGKTIYILDEPTTGLHMADVHKLIEVLQRLVDAGNTVVVIEHNLDVIKTSDYVIDLGPEGGDRGGTVVACGTPETVAKCAKSYTGQYLKDCLDKA